MVMSSRPSLEHVSKIQNWNEHLPMMMRVPRHPEMIAASLGGETMMLPMVGGDWMCAPARWRVRAGGTAGLWIVVVDELFLFKRSDICRICWHAYVRLVFQLCLIVLLNCQLSYCAQNAESSEKCRREMLSHGEVSKDFSEDWTMSNQRSVYQQLSVPYTKTNPIITAGNMNAYKVMIILNSHSYKWIPINL